MDNGQEKLDMPEIWFTPLSSNVVGFCYPQPKRKGELLLPDSFRGKRSEDAGVETNRLLVLGLGPECKRGLTVGDEVMVMCQMPAVARMREDGHVDQLAIIGEEFVVGVVDQPCAETIEWRKGQTASSVTKSFDVC